MTAASPPGATLTAQQPQTGTRTPQRKSNPPQTRTGRHANAVTVSTGRGTTTHKRLILRHTACGLDLGGYRVVPAAIAIHGRTTWCGLCWPTPKEQS